MAAQPQPQHLLRRFPPEIRFKIYPHSLAMGWDTKVPNLLAALVEEPDLFEEATRVYLKINANINCRTRSAYNSILLKSKEVFKLEHLLISCPRSPNDEPSIFPGSLIKLMNNLSTISLDLTTCHKLDYSHLDTSALRWIFELDNASSCLTRVAVRIESVEMVKPEYTDARKEEFRETRRELIEFANRRFGVKGRLEQIPDEVQCPDSWFWETMDGRGGRLKITPGWK